MYRRYSPNSKDIKWQKKYDELKKYIEDNRKLPGYSEENHDLFIWIDNQRKYYRRNKLPSDRMLKLSNLDFWDWDGESRTDTKWLNNYNRLKKFIDDNDRFPKSTTNEENLGYWVVRQRQNYHDNRLSQKRISMLEDLKLWKWSFKERNDLWLEKFNELEKFLIENGRFPYYILDRGYGDPENILYGWMITQKNHYSKKILTTYNIYKLEGLSGWTWSLDLQYLDDSPFLDIRPNTKKRKVMDISYLIDDDDTQTNNKKNKYIDTPLFGDV